MAFVTWALIVVGCSRDSARRSVQPPVPQSPEQMTVYSLDPGEKRGSGETGSADTFHGFAVLGKVDVVESAVRQSVASALKEAIEAGGKNYKCFQPRHGIRVVQGGQIVEYVICFRCENFCEFIDGSKEGRFRPIGREARPALDHLLLDAGIDIAR